MKWVVFSLFAICSLAFQLSDPVTPEKLGEQLFNDPILSLDSTVSCASCHIPAFAFCDTAAFSGGWVAKPAAATHRVLPI
jgi:cytochrome c peroxidase